MAHDGPMARASIGTCGWSYEGWRDAFYRGVPRRRWLTFAAERFTGLEIDATFYRRQRRRTFERWRDEVPDDFRFAVKGHRYVTHVLRLREPEAAIEGERERADGLGAKLGAVLWQLPPNLERDPGRLERFAAALERRWPARHAIEFRHRSWFEPGIARLLRAHGLAVCISDGEALPMWDTVTAGFVYIRLHGHTRRYASAYRADALRRWAGRIRGWLDEGRDVHAYFDNDAEGAAPGDALRLLELIRAR